MSLKNDCYLEIHAGVGSPEAHDWAEMLQRMYMRWADQHSYKVEWIDEDPGKYAGIKSTILKINGNNAYGWLKTESGVHRLVRISPYDPRARRHTSFASIWVYPVVDDNIEIEVDDKDLRIDTYRSSGHDGGRLICGVRITHIPTGIVVQCQTDRSLHKNRAAAMSVLKAQLYARAAKIDDIGWGHQIRSYVLQPYQMVKDLRTNVETSNTQGVLDGDLDQFMDRQRETQI